MRQLILAAPLMCLSQASWAGLVEPETIAVLGKTSSGLSECGIAADYLLSGTLLRVELSGAPSASGGGTVFIRAYVPNSVGPLMRDLWLKTTTLFSLGQFKPARENSQGILDASGPLDRRSTAAVVREIADGDVEVSIIFDGTLPAARLPVGLPSPLPSDIAATLNDCAAAMEK